MSRRELIVLGGGVAGLSTAAFLAREEGVRVTLVEREARHDAHSTGRSAEILRVAVDDPVTRALALDSAAALEAPATAGLDAGPLVERTGLAVLTDGEPPWAEELEARGVSVRQDLAFLSERAPHAASEDARVHWLAGGGRIRGQHLVASLARSARRSGATLLRSAGPAEALTADGRAVGVRLAGGRTLEADDVVVAAGAWSGPIARALGLDLPLRTTRRHMFLTDADPGGPAAPPVVWDDAAGVYLRREGRRWGLSVCDVLDGGVDPVDYSVDPAVLERAVEAVRRWIPGPEGPLGIAHGWSGLRDLTPDDRPILGPDPRMPGLHWCCGLGGHGMTLSIGVGRAAAAAVLGRPHPHAERCEVGRFESVPA